MGRTPDKRARPATAEGIRIADSDGSPSTPRDRILAAMVALVGARGYEGAMVDELIRSAEVTRGSYYRLFKNRHQCLAAAHAALIERIERRLGEAIEPGGDPCARAKAALEALCALLGGEPAAARVVLVESGTLVRAPGPGPSGASRPRSEGPRALVDVVEGAALGGLREAASPEALRMAAGGVFAALRSEYLAHGAGALPALAPELAFAALCPIVGTEVALAQLRGAAAEPSGAGA